jgi:hypothetical protein
MFLATPLSVSILSPLALYKEEEYLGAIRLYCDLLPQLLPEKWGWWEPLRTPFDPQNLNTLLPVKEFGRCSTIEWKRGKRPKAEGSFRVRWQSSVPEIALDTHSQIQFDVELRQVEQAILVNYLKRESVYLKSDLAFIESVTESYKDFAYENDSGSYGHGRLMMSTHLLRHWLPDVFWATIFGPAYVRLFGKENLLSAPAYHVEELGEEMIYVQLSERMEDIVDKSAEIQAARDRFKKHFKCNAFFVSGKSYDYKKAGPIGKLYDVPKFVLCEP